MPWGLKRSQQTRDLHFLTFSCYQRAPLLNTPQKRDIFLEALEQSRRWYGFYVVGYVVMPEHVHLLISEPERTTLRIAIQMLKQRVSQKLRGKSPTPFLATPHYDFKVWSERKRIQKLRYLHRNPVTRGIKWRRPRTGPGVASDTTSPAKRAS
jgi:putative transposase